MISEIELLSYPALSATEEAAIRELLEMTQRLGLTDGVRNHAIHLRRETRIKLPDAIIAATAMEWQAVLITNDQRLALIPGLTTQALLLK